MKFEIHNKNLKLSEHQSAYIEKKLDKICSMWRVMKDDNTLMKLNFEWIKAQDKHHNISCHIVIHLPKQVLTTTTLWQSVEESIDLAESKVLHQLETYKVKHYKAKLS